MGSENESTSSSISGPKSASKVYKKDKQARTGSRKVEVGKSSSLGGERIGKIREEQEDAANGTNASSSQTSNSKNTVISTRKTSSVTRKPSKSKLVAGEVKHSALPTSVKEHMKSAANRSEKQQVYNQNQQQSLSVG